MFGKIKEQNRNETDEQADRMKIVHGMDLVHNVTKKIELNHKEIE